MDAGGKIMTMSQKLRIDSSWQGQSSQLVVRNQFRSGDIIPFPLFLGVSECKSETMAWEYT